MYPASLTIREVELIHDKGVCRLSGPRGPVAGDRCAALEKFDNAGIYGVRRIHASREDTANL